MSKKIKKSRTNQSGINKSVIFFILSSLWHYVYGQNLTPSEIKCGKASTVIRIDGLIDEEPWLLVDSISNFTMVAPG